MAGKPSITTRDMGSLSLNTPHQKPKSKGKKPAVADSWEDESDSEPEPGVDSASSPKDITASTSSGFQAPPPTPASPSYLSGGTSPWQSMAAGGDPSYLNAEAARRPEKTDAVARRMIASALGVKAPRRTEEEKAYDRALREKERKRREDERVEERRQQEEAEKAKAAIWDD